MELRSVDPRALIVNPDNPRRSTASPDADAQMAASIKVVGIIQPPIVRETSAGLEIVYGERRVRGAITNDLASIAVLVVDATTSDHAMAALVENVVRAPLSPIDQWRAIDRLETAGWTQEAIATTLAQPIRTVRKLKLLAHIHPPMLAHMAKGQLPGERELRVIAQAPLEDQASVWKKHKPKAGQPASWFEIGRALHRQRMPASHARFDDALAQAFGIVWCEDLFAPADEDGRYTMQVEEFLAAQQEWIQRNLPENGVILTMDTYGQPKLPPKAHRLYGAKLRKTDGIGFYVTHDGRVETIEFRPAEPAPTKAKGTADPSGTATRVKTARPPVTKKGEALIGELRTSALHQALEQAPIEDHMLLGLLVLALAGDNVDVKQPVGSPDYQAHGARRRILGRLTEGGSLTQDTDTLRRAARTMLAAVLSCRVDGSSSGIAARHAGAAVGADQFLPNMATEEFLGCLSKPALEQAALANDIGRFDRAKDTRAVMCRAFTERTFVYPGARFAPTAEELAAGHRGSGDDEQPNAAPDEDQQEPMNPDADAGYADDGWLDDGNESLELHADAA